MKNDEGRFEPRRKINRLERLFDRPLPLPRRAARKSVAIRRRSHHFHRKRTKIVQAAEAHLTRLEHFLHPRHEGKANAMPQLDELKAELVLDLAQHRFARGVAAGVPAGGEGQHRSCLTKSRTLRPLPAGTSW